MINGDGAIWRYTTSFLAGVVLTGIASYISAQKDLITRREFIEYQIRVDKRLDSHDDQLGKIIGMINQDAMEIGRITEDLKLETSQRKRGQN